MPQQCFSARTTAATGSARSPASAGIVNVADAYAVQREFVRLQMRARGAAAVGYKIGLTTRRMQEMCGIDSPIAGVVRDCMYVSGAVLKASAFRRLGVEFEIAVRLGRDLAADGRAPGSKMLLRRSMRSDRRWRSSTTAQPTMPGSTSCR